MIRIASIGLVILLTALCSFAIVRAWPSQPITVCYQTDGERIETAYIDGGATAFYPIETEASVQHMPDGFVAVHRVTFEARTIKFRLPMVMR